MTANATKTLGERVEALEARMTRLETTGTRTLKPRATDDMMDGPNGNPVMRNKDPRGWTGQSYVGYKMGDATPEYLELAAGLFDWQADQDDKIQKRSEKTGQLTAGYKRRDASLARGWAQRLRDGWKPGMRTKTPNDFLRDLEEATNAQDDRVARRADAEETFAEEPEDEIPF